jgi:hypothetical protein
MCLDIKDFHVILHHILNADISICCIIGIRKDILAATGKQESEVVHVTIKKRGTDDR